MKKGAVWIVSLGMLWFAAADVVAQRHGWVAGIGLGGGRVGHAQDEFTDFGGQRITAEFDRTSYLLATDLKLGYAMTTRWLVYGFGHLNWFSFRYSSRVRDYAMIQSLIGLGTMYYLSSNARSWFVSAGAGHHRWTLPFDEDEGSILGALNAQRGWGAFVGSGYEFWPHLTMETQLLLAWSEADVTESGFRTGIETGAVAVRLTLNYLFYRR